MEKFKPVLPSHFSTSLVHHFPLSSALLCLFPYHIHPLTPLYSPTHTFLLLFPSNFNSPSAASAFLSPSLNSFPHPLPSPTYPLPPTPFRSNVLIFISSSAPYPFPSNSHSWLFPYTSNAYDIGS